MSLGLTVILNAMTKEILINWIFLWRLLEKTCILAHVFSRASIQRLMYSDVH